MRQVPAASAPASVTSSPVGKLTAVIRAQQPQHAVVSGAVPTAAAAAVSAAARPVIQQQKVHIQAGQPQQSIVLPVRTTPLTSTSAPVSSISVPVTSIAHLPTHPTGAIQTVKIGGGQAQVWTSEILKMRSVLKIFFLQFLGESDGRFENHRHNYFKCSPTQSITAGYR